MGWVFRTSTFTLLVSIALSALGQGGAAGYGQGPAGSAGGFGGGGGGGRGIEGGELAPDPNDGPRRLSEWFQPRDAEHWSSRTAILTPGDRVEFKLDVKAGQTVVARASSESFDAALELVDDKGTVIAKNDDRMEGDQSPIIIKRIPRDGNYLLKVVSFRSAAGGKFELKFRILTPMDIPVGKFNLVPPQPKTDGRKPQFLRFTAKKDEFYCIRDLRGKTGSNPLIYMQFQTVFGPSYVYDADVRFLNSNPSYPVFQTKQDGEYYIEVSDHYRSERVEGTLWNVKRLTLSDSLSKVQLQPGETVLFSSSVEPGTLQQLVVDKQAGLGQYVDAPRIDDNTRRSQNFSGDGVMHSQHGDYAEFLTFKRKAGPVIRAFRLKGEVLYIITNENDSARDVSVRLDPNIPEWRPEVLLNESLAIGECKFYLLKSSLSELMRVKASASAFLPKLDIYSTQGQLLNSLSNPETNEAADDLYFEKQNTFLIRLSCDGYGGSGPFTLRRDTIQPIPYALGSSGSINLDGQNYGLYSVNLEKGKRYELVYDSGGVWSRIDLLDDAGTFLRSGNIAFGNLWLHYFEPERSGRHRLWLRGGNGVRKFTLREHVAPKP